MWTSLIIVAHIIVIIGVSVRVIMMRLPVGTALAWIVLIFFLPFAGAVIYLVLGEKRLGRKRTQRAASLWGRYSRWLRELPRQAPDDQSGLSPEAAAVSRLPEGAARHPGTARQPAGDHGRGRADFTFHHRRHRPGQAFLPHGILHLERGRNGGRSL